MNLPKNTDLDQNGYSGYDIGFDARSQFRYQVVRRVKTFFFLINMLSVHSYNRKKNILILGEEPTDGLDDTTVTAEAKHSVNITKSR